MKKYGFALLLSLLPCLVSAHNGDNGWVTVSNFQLWSNTYTDPQIRVLVTDGYYNPSGCPTGSLDSYMVSTALSEKLQDRIYSTLLAAVLAKKSVRLKIETNGCEIDRPRITNVMID